MKKIKFPFTKNMYEYDLIHRAGMWAFVRKSNLLYPDAPISFEIWNIRAQKKYEYPKGNIVPAKEMMPGNEQWGIYGFSFMEFQDASEFFSKRANLHDRFTTERLKPKFNGKPRRNGIGSKKPE